MKDLAGKIRKLNSPVKSVVLNCAADFLCSQGNGGFILGRAKCLIQKN